jgi:hypothetical protein
MIMVRVGSDMSCAARRMSARPSLQTLRWPGIRLLLPTEIMSAEHRKRTFAKWPDGLRQISFLPRVFE